MKLFYFLIPLYLVLNISCSDDDAADPEANCSEGTTECQNGMVMRCDGGQWATLEDCSTKDKVCVDGECIERPSYSFYAESFKVSGNEMIDADFVSGAKYLLVPYFVSKQIEDVAYEININDPNYPQSKMTRKIRSEPRTTDPFEMRIHAFEKRIARESELRTKELFLLKEHNHRISQSNIINSRKLKAGQECLLSSECEASEICHGGECLSSIPVHFSGWTIETDLYAQVVAKGEQCVIMLDENNEGELSADDAQNLLDACDNIMLPRNYFFFGDPVMDIDGTPINVADRDDDGLLQVLISSNVNDENVWGFFDSSDFYPNDDPDYPSNERDIIYVSLPDSSEELPSIEATIIHEHQHLLHFAIRGYGQLLQGKASNMNPIWLNEACSHLVEEIGGYGVDTPYILNNLFENFNNCSITSTSDSLDTRAMGMMLMLYLFEQAGGVRYDSDGVTDLGGAEFLRNIISSEQTGYAALEKVVGRPWESFFFDWLVAVAIDGTELSGDPRYNYHQPVNDPLTGRDIGIITNGFTMETDGGKLNLDGPEKMTFSSEIFEGSLSSNGANFISTTSASLQAGNVSAFGPDSGFLLGVIRIE